jgi:hypothetical protein
MYLYFSTSFRDLQPKTKTDTRQHTTYYKTVMGVQTVCSSTLRVRCKSVTKYRMLVHTPRLLQDRNIFPYTRQHVVIRQPSTLQVGDTYHMFVNTSCLISVRDKFPHTRQHVTIRPPPTGVTQARDTWTVTSPSPLPQWLLVSSEGTRHNGFVSVGSRELLRSFLRCWGESGSRAG